MLLEINDKGCVYLANKKIFIGRTRYFEKINVLKEILKRVFFKSGGGVVNIILATYSLRISQGLN